MAARMASPFVVSDELWSKIEPLLPVYKNTHRFGGGKPRKPDRVCMDAIFFVLRTGCQWKALDATGICPGSTAHDRFQEWVQAGVFLRLWETGLEEYDELKGLNWSWLSMDGAMTKAPLGGGKNRPQSNGSRQRRSQAIVAFGSRRSSRGSGCRWGQPA
jgi:transposase